MRKHGRLFIFALLLLLTPSLASAWTLYVKVQGNSSDGTVTIIDSAVPPVTTTLVGGQKYVQLTGAATATVVLSDGIAADVKLDYVDALPVDGLYALTSANSSLVVSMGQAATAQGDVSVVKSNGGNTLVTYLGKNTMTGYTNLKFGTTVGVKANPRSDYKVASITITDVALGLGTPYAQTTGAGVTVTKALEIASTEYSVSATYELVANAKAVLSAPLKAVVGKAVTVNAAGSTSNTTLSYVFSNNKAFAGTTTGSSYTFTPTTTGDVVVTLTLNGGLAEKTTTINVVSEATANNSTCLGCHTGSTPAIVAAYNAGTHGSSNFSCVDCHTEAPHSAAAEVTLDAAHSAAAVADSCTNCHQSITNTFATSLHGTRPGKGTFYNDGLGEVPVPLQQGFGNFVDVDYAILPCADCHNAAAWTVNGVDTWTAPSCVDCHSNRANDGSGGTTLVSAPVAASTCYACHSRQAYEGMAFGLTDVHTTAGMGCSSCHASSDMHGDGMTRASILEPGANSARCENCHGAETSQGVLDMTIPEHGQHMVNVDCSTCHMQSVVACYNCHFDNEGINDGSVTHQKFASAKFGGQGEKSWRFLVNRVIDNNGTTKVYPGSMQSLMADVTATGDGLDDGQGVTFVAIASYYAHSITRVDALTCDKCHGIENAVKLNNGLSVDVVKWNAEAGVVKNYGPEMMGTWQGPKGVIPVPEDTSLLNFDFVDITNPAGAWDATNMNVISPRVLFKRGADVVHMPEDYVKPLNAAQIQALANPYRAGVLTAAAGHPGDYTTSNAALVTSTGTCTSCHTGVSSLFTTAQHNTVQGKETFYNNNIDNPTADPLQKGFGNYVTVDYDALPCAKCHNAAAWTVGGVDTWPGAFGEHVCTDCHGNTTAGVATTAFDAPVTKDTCIGCHTRQKTETALGLTDVHTATMGCTVCHTFSDMHGDGTADGSLLSEGAISAQCENCHGAETVRGAITNIAAHQQHQGDIACSTCHMESVITCYNCHFDNEASDPTDATILHAKFASAKFGGTKASGKAWRFLVNRVMPDGSTKIYPASMQSLVADRTASNFPGEDDKGWSHAVIAPYYSHSITKVNALSCDECHGIQNAIDLAAGTAIDVVKWNAGVWTPPKGVIPVPEDAVNLLNMDFVDLVNPAAPLNPTTGSSSSARKFFKAGLDSVHMPEEYVKPLTAAQIQKLADPQFDHTSEIATASEPVDGSTANSCMGCHETTNEIFATALHNTVVGKATFYTNNVGVVDAEPLQKGFGNYVTTDYADLPCAKCHNASAWTVAGVDTWPGSFGQHVCTDCHTNQVAGVATTSFDAPITANTCKGCHTRQKTEREMGLTDVHETAGMGCASCHSTSDMHGNGTTYTTLLADGAISAQCENCHGTGTSQGVLSAAPEHTTHLANIACSTCHMESVITCYNCHFDNEASDPTDATILHAKFASGKFGGTKASGKAWRFLVNRVMGDGSTKVYPASMQSLVADRTASNSPGEDNIGTTHAVIAPYYSHSITKVNALKCVDCHNNANAQALLAGTPVDVFKWNAAAGVQVPVASMMANWTGPTGIIPVPENPVGKLHMDFIDLVNPAAGPLTATGTSPSPRVLFKDNGPDSIHMPEAYVTPLSNAQLQDLATPR